MHGTSRRVGVTIARKQRRTPRMRTGARVDCAGSLPSPAREIRAFPRAGKSTDPRPFGSGHAVFLETGLVDMEAEAGRFEHGDPAVDRADGLAEVVTQGGAFLDDELKQTE